MERIGRTLLILWMAANAAHLPVPVFDGDSVGTRAVGGASAPAFQGIDVDCIFLGCDEPDDSDDGPIDDDPERSEFAHGPFPNYLRSPGAADLQIDSDASRANPAFGCLPPASFRRVSALMPAPATFPPSNTAAALGASPVMQC